MTDTSPSPARNSWLLPISVIVILALVVAVFWPKPEPIPPVVVTTTENAEYSTLLTAGREAQLKSDWCAAREAFQKLKDKLDVDKPGQVEMQEEVSRNLRMLATLCPDKEKPDTIPVPDLNVEVDVPKKKVLPEPLSEEAFIERNPVGKTIRSIGHFVVNGKGVNKSWGVRGTASFSYLSEVPVETRVVESDAGTGRLVFEQKFGEVVQVRAVSKQTLELVPPDSLVLRTIWPTADHKLMRLSPGYVFFREVTDAINATDPGLKRTLTRTSAWLRRAGLEVTAATPDTELAVQVEKLSGSRLKIVYVSGLGVTHISRLEGMPLNRDELVRLAHSSTVLVDYIVFPTAKRKQGEKWDVRADDVGSLFALYDPQADIGGTITLRRDADSETGQVAKLALVGGSVTAQSEVDGKEQRGHLAVKSGTMSIDLKRFYIRISRIQFSASTLHQSKDHLLFGTEQLRDLNVESRYEAEVVGAEAKPPAAVQP